MHVFLLGTDSKLLWLYAARTAGQAKTWPIFKKSVADGEISSLSKSNLKSATELIEVDWNVDISSGGKMFHFDQNAHNGRSNIFPKKKSTPGVRIIKKHQKWRYDVISAVFLTTGVLRRHSAVRKRNFLA